MRFKRKLHQLASSRRLWRTATVLFAIAYGLIIFIMWTSLGDNDVKISKVQHYKHGRIPIPVTKPPCSYNLEENRKPQFISLGREIWLLQAVFNRLNNETFIRILASMPTWKEMSPIYCLVKTDFGITEAFRADVKYLKSSRHKINSAYQLVCNVTGKVTDNPCSLRVSFETSINSNWTTLNVLDSVQKGKGNIGVCLSPIYFGDIPEHHLVEMLELQIMIYDHVYIYDTSHSTIINHYRSRPNVTVWDWSMPKILQNTTYRFGLPLAYAHCLRAASTSLLFFADLDEVLVPEKEPLWPTLPHSSSAYCLSTIYIEPVYGAVPLTGSSTESRKCSSRMKCFVKPSTIENIDTWGTPELYEGNIFVITMDVATVKHYAPCRNQHCLNKCNDIPIQDRIVADRYESRLKKAIQRVMHSLHYKPAE
ncbi:unnamed protein product [Dimorphilus gyrociliatus]|uniref:Glycosyltransferase family 92 protein n=1 Tax=Dimorphilus gyrociliatus TaxID=2664684 RepID=A0A7I8W6H1_9ANNE|nr:unnamed protein product [Dimorphilus gyrociliatus]